MSAGFWRLFEDAVQGLPPSFPLNRLQIRLNRNTSWLVQGHTLKNALRSWADAGEGVSPMSW
jgi:hypothetical protein